MIPLLDLVAQYRDLQPEVDEALHRVLAGGRFILGPEVEALEREVAAHLGAAHGVGVASGTDALLLALRAVGVGPGDEVVVPAYTFFATAGAVMLAGAKPVLVDIEPDRYGIDAEAAVAAMGPRTKAVVPVHLYGHPADMGPLLDGAQARGVPVVEDNAQAFGAEWRGRRTGSLGQAGCLSFFPSKNLGGYGDGGMVVTSDAAVAARVRRLRTHGWERKYFPEELGYNSRLDELQAAVLRVKLKRLDGWNERRRALAARYDARLRRAGAGLPAVAKEASHVYHLYVVRVPDRERVRERLKAAGVASDVYYPQPLHLAAPLRSLGYRKGDFPQAERASAETLAIPLYPEMTDAQADAVCAALEAALDGAR